MTTDYSRVLADGTIATSCAAGNDHVAVIDHDVGLMFCVTSIGLGEAHDAPGPADPVLAACRAVRLLGYDDWRAATLEEALRIVRPRFRVPSLYQDLFPRIQPFPHWVDAPITRALAGDPRDDGPMVTTRLGTTTGDYGDYDVDRSGFAIAVRSVGDLKP